MELNYFRFAIVGLALSFQFRAIQVQSDFVRTEKNRVIAAYREELDGRIGLSLIDLKTERQFAVSFTHFRSRRRGGRIERRGGCLRVQRANLRRRAKQTD